MSCCRRNRLLGGDMSGYWDRGVGTDGSASSLREVDRAGAFAAQEDAKLIVATAYFPAVEKGGWSHAPSHDHVVDPRVADTLGVRATRCTGVPPNPSGGPRPGERRRRPGHRGAADRRRGCRRTCESGRGDQRGPARRRRCGTGHGRRAATGLGARRRCPQSKDRHPSRPHRRIGSSRQAGVP
jgi:hypothetical protein